MEKMKRLVVAVIVMAFCTVPLGCPQTGGIGISDSVGFCMDVVNGPDADIFCELLGVCSFSECVTWTAKEHAATDNTNKQKSYCRDASMRELLSSAYGVEMSSVGQCVSYFETTY